MCFIIAATEFLELLIVTLLPGTLSFSLPLSLATALCPILRGLISSSHIPLLFGRHKGHLLHFIGEPTHAHDLTQCHVQTSPIEMHTACCNRFALIWLGDYL